MTNKEARGMGSDPIN